MPKFTITLKDPDSDFYNVISKVAAQHGLVEKEVCDFVCRYIDCGEYITLQFDFPAGTCEILTNGAAGIDEYDPDVEPEEEPYTGPSTIEHTLAGIEAEQTEVIKIPRPVKKHSYLAELESQLQSAQAEYDEETDNKTPLAVGLKQFIASTKVEVERLKSSV